MNNGELGSVQELRLLTRGVSEGRSSDGDAGNGDVVERRVGGIGDERRVSEGRTACAAQE